MLRQKVLKRVVAGATSLGIKRIFLINAWRLEKSASFGPRALQVETFVPYVVGVLFA